MNKSIVHYISELLYLHDCVIIPEFGGFICNINSAKLDATNDVLIPPSKKIVFNKNLTDNDGLLINHILRHENISIDIATKSVREFSRRIAQELNKNKILRLTNIGLFTLGKENNIIFSQDNLTNYNLSAFGMNNLNIQEVNRLKEMKEKLDTTIYTIRKNDYLQKRIPRIAAVIIPLMVLSFLSITQQEKIDSVYTHMSNLNPFTEIIKTNITEKSNLNSSNTLKLESKNIINNIKLEQKYYIIAGSFVDKKNAQIMYHKLKKWNYNSDLISEGKHTRVSYDSFSNKEDALTALYHIRKSNKEAWILSQ